MKATLSSTPLCDSHCHCASLCVICAIVHDSFTTLSLLYVTLQVVLIIIGAVLVAIVVAAVVYVCCLSDTSTANALAKKHAKGHAAMQDYYFENGGYTASDAGQLNKPSWSGSETASVATSWVATGNAATQPRTSAAHLWEINDYRGAGEMTYLRALSDARFARS
jgi:Tfp pilus assembly protein PilE